MSAPTLRSALTVEPEPTASPAAPPTTETSPRAPRRRLRFERQRADAATLAAIYVALLMIIPSGLIIRGLPLSLGPASVVSLAMALLWVLTQLTSTLGMAKGSNPVRTALFFFAVSLLATYCAAAYGYLPGDELKSLDHSLVLIMGLIGMALLVCDGVRDRRRLDLVLKTIAVASACVAFVAALQFVADFDLTKYMVLPGLKFQEVFDGFVFARSDFRRVSGTTGNPIQFGVLCAMTLPLALHYAFDAKARGAGTWRWWLVTALIASGLMFSVSRSAVLGISTAGAILLMSWPARRRIRALVTTAVFLVVVKIAFPGLLGTFLGLFTTFSSDESVQYRTHDYPIAATEISKHFWLGRGVGTFYAPQHLIFDNQYLLTAVEGGVIGLLAMAGLFVAAVVAVVLIIRRQRSRGDRDLAVTLLACMVVPAVGSVTFDLLSFHTVEGIMFVVLAALGALLRIVTAERRLAAAPDPTPAP